MFQARSLTTTRMSFLCLADVSTSLTWLPLGSQPRFEEEDIVFFKNAYAFAQMRPQLPDSSASDSGIEVDNKP